MYRILSLSALLYAGLATAQQTSLNTTTGKQVWGGPCLQTHNRLAEGTYQLTSDCETTLFCAANSTCAYKGCRRDEYPFGYGQSRDLPNFCPEGQFCPDEEDACQPLLAVGNQCQLNRDDECAPPPNAAQLANKNNVNGSICLNFLCTWANATKGSACIVENIPYIGYDSEGTKEFINIVSRGNCQTGLYCDAPTLQCKETLAMGASCTADKECASDSCLEAGTCGPSPSAPKHFATWVFVVVAVGILAIIAGIVITLFIIHKKNREIEGEKRRQYWREQESFRQNILQMREQARASLLSLPWQNKGGGGFSDYSQSDTNSQTAILHAVGKSSGLRNGFGEEEDFDDMEGLVSSNESGESQTQRRRKMSKSGKMGGRL